MIVMSLYGVGDSKFLSDLHGKVAGYVSTKGIIEKITASDEKPNYSDYHISSGDNKDIMPIADVLTPDIKTFLGIPEDKEIERTPVKAFYLDGELKGFTKPDN